LYALFRERTTPRDARSTDDRVSFGVVRNDAAASRTGHITVRDKVVTITQAGR
jgi:hypothetical protein